MGDSILRSVRERFELFIKDGRGCVTVAATIASQETGKGADRLGRVSCKRTRRGGASP